ncbi:MAG TPA: GAF domain-containing sensor histidine kinase [Candidatus Dormibacteraeota bacterium]|nr:GAF domain-containing sensor histidine kinase [Candidatus Dormibacteraeota bacterium]
MDRRTLELLAIDEDVDLDRVLERVLRAARAAAGARYGALGVPDGRGGFARFLTVGVSERRAAEIGELPRVHGVLGALLDDGPIRLRDIRRHPKFGYYPVRHPVLKDFLGVPVRHRGEVLGNLFLSGSRSGGFTAADQREVETLAAYAGVAIANARLYQQAQELATVEERARVARELHDSVSQRLFSMVYEARAAALRTADPGAREVLGLLERGASAALGEMKALVQAVRPKSLERDGLEATLRDHVEALRRAHGVAIELRVHGSPRLTPSQELALLRIAQEALYNAVRHAGRTRVQVTLEQDADEAQLGVRDWGRGFDPSALPRARRTMGLATMRERAAAVRASFAVESAPGRGTEVRVRLRLRTPRTARTRA